MDESGDTRDTPEELRRLERCLLPRLVFRTKSVCQKNGWNENEIETNRKQPPQPHIRDLIRGKLASLALLGASFPIQESTKIRSPDTRYCGVKATSVTHPPH